MLFFRFGFCCLAAGVLAGCAAPRLSLRYSLDATDKVVDFATNRAWKPALSDTLVARLERGVIPAYTSNNQPLPAGSLRPARRLRGLVFGVGPARSAVHNPHTLKGILPSDGGKEFIDLHFYDRGVELYLFYARVRQTDLEQLVRRPVVFVPLN
jgi:hypothetical protein